jgi:hypothetical protein
MAVWRRRGRLCRICLQSGAHGALDGAIHFFCSREHPLLWVVAFIAVLVDGELPVLHVTRVGQPADRSEPASVFVPQVQMRTPVVGHIVRPGLALQLLDVEASHDGVGL